MEGVRMDVQAIDWEAYVVLAMGDDEFGPRPAQLCEADSQWRTWFEVKHGRAPEFPGEYPEPLARFLEQLARHPLKKGRPRLDQKRWIEIHRAWDRYIVTSLYEMNRELYETFGRGQDGFTVTDFPSETIEQERPNILAMEKLAEQRGVSVEMVRDIIFPRRKQKERGASRSQPIKAAGTEGK